MQSRTGKSGRWKRRFVVYDPGASTVTYHAGADNRGEPEATLPVLAAHAITDPAEQNLVIGGEVTVWSERLDPAIMLSTAFPRAAAAAERL